MEIKEKVVVENMKGMRLRLYIILKTKCLSQNNTKLVFYPGNLDMFWYSFWIYWASLRWTRIVRDGIFITLQTRKKFELLLNSKYFFDFHSSNIKFRSAENKTTFLDALPETIFFLLSCTFSHLLPDLLFFMEQLEQGFPHWS